MAYEDFRQEHVRLSILKTLEGSTSYSANDSVISDALARFGLSSSRGLVSTEDVAGYIVATLTQRGHDVATGTATVPGIKRPTPR